MSRGFQCIDLVLTKQSEIIEKRLSHWKSNIILPDACLLMFTEFRNSVLQSLFVNITVKVLSGVMDLTIVFSCFHSPN